MNSSVKPSQSSVQWLLVKRVSQPRTQTSGFCKVDIYNRDGALAVFSFKEEARMFAASLDICHDWQVEEIDDATLLRLLNEKEVDTNFVALDPLPENIAPEAANLVCVGRRYFLHRLLKRIQQREDSFNPLNLT